MAEAKEKYRIQLVKDEKTFKDLRNFVESENRRLKKIGHKEYHTEVGPSPFPGDFNEYKMELRNAQGKLSEKEKEKLELPAFVEVPRAFALVVRDRKTGKICGYSYHVSKRFAVTDDKLYISPEYRRRGIATKMLKAMENIARKTFHYPRLEYKAHNRSMYKHLLGSGYRPTGRGELYVEKEFEKPSEEAKPAKKEKTKTAGKAS